MAKRNLMDKCKRNYAKSAWAIDYDYTNKLSQEELQFLIGFTLFYYNGYPKKLENCTPEMKRESYNRSNRARRDILNRRMTTITLEQLEIELNKKCDINN